MTSRELATTLAALRYWRQEMIDIQDQDEDNWMADSTHFTEHKPLTVEEIDALCEKLNAPVSPHTSAYADLGELICHQCAAQASIDFSHGRRQHIPKKIEQVLSFRCDGCDKPVNPITVGIYVEGGLVQGARSNLACPTIDIFVYDADNEEQMNDEEKKDEAEVLARYEALPHGIY